MAGTLTIGVLIHRNGEWLGPDLVELADEAQSSSRGPFSKGFWYVFWENGVFQSMRRPRSAL